MKNSILMMIVLLASISLSHASVVLPVKNVKASSTLPNQGKNNYSPENMLEKGFSRVWAAPFKGKPITLEFSVDAERVNAIELYNGYLRDSASFVNNSLVKKMKVYLNSKDNLVKTVPLKKRGWQSNAAPEADLIEFEKPLANVKKIIVEINDIYPGNKWKDVCVTLFRVLGDAKASSELKTGRMTDPRDGKTYKTVKIGNQTWMAENLNYETRDSYCYEDKESNCEKYGRLYTWSAAKNACPEGWHLSSKDEFETLINFVGGEQTAGKKMKSENGWNNGVGGTNVFGFSALPAGDRSYSGMYDNEGIRTEFWSSTKNGNVAYRMFLYYGNDYARLDVFKNNYGYSVRCLKNYLGDENTDSPHEPPKMEQPKKELPKMELSKANTLTDPRDGKTYKIVKIGNQTWMAENLNVKTKDSWCYDNNESNCEKYGRLYTWNAAMKACPSGWHLPSRSEFKTLFEAVGGESEAGKMLKSKAGWSGRGNGLDAYAFSALPTGYRKLGNFGSEGDDAHFWSSTEHSSSYAYNMILYYYDVNARLDSYNEDLGFSVRCLKGESPSSDTPQSSSSSTSVSRSSAQKTLTDSRDGQTYRTVKIGSQTWMAENLNVKTKDSWCYDDEESNCKKYGRLYTWRAAMKACPSGWHLPSKSEFKTLIEAVGGKSEAGKMLKSKTGWRGRKPGWRGSGNGTDAYAFSALPAGFRDYSGYGGHFGFEGGYAHFWSSTEDGYLGNEMFLDYDLDDAHLGYDHKIYGFSVRCIKD